MVLLENSIFNLRVDFNKKIEHLKKQKVKIIDNVKTTNARIREINKELGVEEELFEPQIDEKIEYPENVYNVKYNEIVEFAKKQAKQANQPQEVKKSAFGTKKVDPNVKVEKTREEIEAEAFEAAYLKEMEEQKVHVEEKPHVEIIERHGKKTNENDLDREMREIRVMELEYEKEML